MPNGQQGTQPTGQAATPPQGQPTEVHATPPPITPPTPEGGAQPVAAPQPAAGGSEVDGVTRTEGGFLVRSEAFKRLKTKEREKGKAAALEVFAQEQGFDTVEAMQEALKKRGASPGRRNRRSRRRNRRSVDGSTPTPEGGAVPANQNGQEGAAAQPSAEAQEIRKEIRRLERRLEASEGKNTNLASRARKADNATRRLRQERDALEAEMIVREAAAHVGIQNVDYALHLLTKHLEGKPEEDLEGFDEVKYFKGLRDDHSYLFGETTKPATTGNGAGAAPPTPTPGAAQQGAAQGGQVDARKMSREEYQKHLASRGLNTGL